MYSTVEVRVLYKQFHGTFLVARWDAELLSCSEQSWLLHWEGVRGTGQQGVPPGQWTRWFEPVALACARDRSGFASQPTGRRCFWWSPAGSAGARLIERPGGSSVFLCAPLGLFSSVLVYFRKLEVFSVTKVPFLF